MYVTLGKRLIFTDLTLIKMIGSPILSQHLEVKSIDFIYLLLKLLHESFSLGWICYVNDFCPSTNQEKKKTALKQMGKQCFTTWILNKAIEKLPSN